MPSVGGAGRAKGTRSTVEEYDPVTDTWTQKAGMPTRRSALSTSVVNGKIYAIGGSDHPKVFSTMEMYDPVTDKWTQKADMRTARMGLSTSVVNGKIYAIGGYNLVEDFLTVEMYDPATDMWVKKADMPTPRSNFATGVVNGGIHAIGGTAILGRGELGRWETISKVEVYQPARDRWTKEVDMWVLRGYIAASTVNGKIYVIGGTSVRPGLPLAKVEEFDTGFAVNPAGKLATSWGQIKSVR
jgi:N-acetylneuraminic acid mutarotase